ncbi:MAG: glycosyltransferase family 2 protein [Pseudomonadota bacterium]
MASSDTAPAQSGPSPAQTGDENAPGDASMRPRISIVVPSFRAAGTIARTLDSLFSQDYPNLQVIVMDGESNDGTVDVIKTYDDRIDFWVSEKDKCQADALNKGFARADGDYFGWLCADDTLLPGALSTMADFLTAHPDCDFVTGGCKRVFNDDAEVVTEPAPDFLDQLDYKNTIEQPSSLWRASAHRRAGELDLTYKYAFDWEYWCRLKRTGATFERIVDPMSVYFFSDDNLTSSGGTKIADEMYRVVKQYGPYNGRLADVYRFLYRTFDLRGFYDPEIKAEMPEWKQRMFHTVLNTFYYLYDRDTINAYNWNFASRQERGLGWR